MNYPPRWLSYTTAALVMALCLCAWAVLSIPEARLHAYNVAHAPGPVVWLNTRSRVYHLPGSRWYGRTLEGRFIPEAQARAEGDRAAVK